MLADGPPRRTALAEARREEYTGEDARRVVVSRVRITRDCIVPDTATLYRFESPNGTQLCWRPSVQRADEFVKTLGDPQSTRISGRASLRIFFPVYGSYYVVKSYDVGVSGRFTLQRVLRLTEGLAEIAIAHFMKNVEGRHDIRKGDVKALLSSYAICSLRIKEDRIYVSTHDARHRYAQRRLVAAHSGVPRAPADS